MQRAAAVAAAGHQNQRATQPPQQPQLHRQRPLKLPVAVQGGGCGGDGGGSAGSEDLAALCQGMRLDSDTVRKLRALLNTLAATAAAKSGVGVIRNIGNENEATGGGASSSRSRSGSRSRTCSATTGSTRTGRSCISDIEDDPVGSTRRVDSLRRQVDAVLTESPAPSCRHQRDDNQHHRHRHHHAADKMDNEIQRLRDAVATVAAEEAHLARVTQTVQTEIGDALGALGHELRRRRAAMEAGLEAACQRQLQHQSHSSQPLRQRAGDQPSGSSFVRRHAGWVEERRQPHQHHRVQHKQPHTQSFLTHHNHQSSGGGSLQSRRRAASVSSDMASNSLPVRPAPFLTPPLSSFQGLDQQLQQLQRGMRDLLGALVPPKPRVSEAPEAVAVSVAAAPPEVVACADFGRVTSTVRTGSRPLGACACTDTAGFACRPSRLLLERRPAGGSWRPLPSPCIYVHFALPDAAADTATEAAADADDDDAEGEDGEADAYAMSVTGERLARLRFGAGVRRIRAHGQALFVATADGRVAECDLAGRRLRVLDGLLRPAGLFADARSLFVYEAGRSRVAVYDRDGGGSGNGSGSGGLRLSGIVQLRASDRRLPACAGLAALGCGLLVLVDSRSRPCDRCRRPGESARRLLVFDRGSNRVVATFPRDASQGYCLHEPCGLAADSRANIVYVCDRRWGCVLALSAPSGHLVARLGDGRLSVPCSVDLIAEPLAAAGVESADFEGRPRVGRQRLLVCDTKRGRLLELDVTHSQQQLLLSAEQQTSHQVDRSFPLG